MHEPVHVFGDLPRHVLAAAEPVVNTDQQVGDIGFRVDVARLAAEMRERLRPNHRGHRVAGLQFQFGHAEHRVQLAAERGMRQQLARLRRIALDDRRRMRMAEPVQRAHVVALHRRAGRTARRGGDLGEGGGAQGGVGVGLEHQLVCRQRRFRRTRWQVVIARRKGRWLRGRSGRETCRQAGRETCRQASHPD